MMPDHRHGLPSRTPGPALLRLALGCVLLLWSGAASAQEAASVPQGFEDLVVPAGFESLLEPSLTYADVYFGGRPIGSTTATYGPGFFRFEEPLEVLTRIGEITDFDVVLRAMGGALDPHEDMVCYSTNQTGCGVIDPEVVGVIYNADTFRADIFVNPAYLDISGLPRDRYMPDAALEPAFTSGVRGSFSGSDGQQVRFSGDNHSVLGFGNSRAVSDLSYQTSDGAFFESLRGEHDTEDWRFGGGLIDTLGTQFVNNATIFGVTATTSLDRRLDLGTATGTEVILFLPQRAQVEVLRDGRVLSSQFLQAGNQLIDTSSLPDGSYELTLRITELNGEVREETTFFSKSRRLPPVDAPSYTLQAGVLANEFDNAGLRKFMPSADSAQPFLRLGTLHRITDDLGLGSSLVGTDDVGVGEISAIAIGTDVMADVALMWSTDNDRGVRAGVSGMLLDWSFNVTGQRVWAGEATQGLQPNNASFDPITDNRVQLSGSLSHSYDWGRVTFLGSWNRDFGSSVYSYGPNVVVPLWGDTASQATLSLSATQSNRETLVQGLFTYSWGNSLTPWSFTSQGGGQYVRDNDAGTVAGRTGELGRANASWRGTDLLLRDQLILGGGAFRDTSRDGVEASMAYGAQGVGNLSTSAIRSRNDSGDQATNYNGNFDAGLIGNLDNVRPSGAGVQGAGIVLTLEGRTGEAVFDVIVGGQRFGTMTSGESRAINLTPYQTYQVRVEPISGGFINVLTPPQAVTLYPGNVVTVIFEAAKIVPVFGRIVSPDGRPIGIARILGTMDASVTDEQGFFQSEMAGGGVLTIQPLQGPECEVTIDDLGDSDVFVKLGTLVCVEADDA